MVIITVSAFVTQVREDPQQELGLLVGIEGGRDDDVCSWLYAVKTLGHLAERVGLIGSLRHALCVSQGPRDVG
jgi:hypothetical protein